MGESERESLRLDSFDFFERVARHLLLQNKAMDLKNDIFT